MRKIMMKITIIAGLVCMGFSFTTNVSAQDTRKPACDCKDPSCKCNSTRD